MQALPGDRRRLYLVRHAQTQWNVEGRYQGRLDSALTQRGRREADGLAQRFAPLARRCFLLCSPLARAAETARIIGETIPHRPVIDDRLVELAYGEWEGLIQHDVKRAWPALLRAWKLYPPCVRFPGGESLGDLRRRVNDFLRDAVRYPISVIAVTHDAFVRVAALEVTGQGLETFRSVRLQTGSVTIFRPTDQGFVLERLGDVTHLACLEHPQHAAGESDTSARIVDNIDPFRLESDSCSDQPSAFS